MREETHQKVRADRPGHRGKRIVLGVLLVLLAAVAWGAWFFISQYVIVGGTLYARDLKDLDLTGTSISVRDYEALRRALPECRIQWDVPYQEYLYSSDLESLRVVEMTDEDIRKLAYFPELKEVDATDCTDFIQVLKLIHTWPDLKIHYKVNIDGVAYKNDVQKVTMNNITQQNTALLDYLPELLEVDASQCTDYEGLQTLKENHPGIHFLYTVDIGDQHCGVEDTQMRLENPDAAGMEQLGERLKYLPAMKDVHLVEPNCQPEVLTNLCQQYPDVNITWEKLVFGQNHFSTEQEIDLSGREITLKEVEDGMQYLPFAQKVNMSFCGFDNETMADFREKMRPQFKVVWTVIVTGEKVRTDDTIFHSSGRHMCLVNELSYDLVYCEDMIILDIGHSMVKYIEWVKGMPNLKYLILADNWIKDITPISTCKNLIYLELFINKHLKDLTPLQGCTALEDLNVAQTNCPLAPLAEMPWLKNLWVNSRKVTSEERELLSRSLPNTHIEFDHGFSTGGGWRQLQNYFDMRDMMGLPRNAW